MSFQFEFELSLLTVKKFTTLNHIRLHNSRVLILRAYSRSYFDSINFAVKMLCFPQSGSLILIIPAQPIARKQNKIFREQTSSDSKIVDSQPIGLKRE